VRISFASTLGCFMHFPEIDQVWNSPVKMASACLFVVVALLIFAYHERLTKISRLIFLAAIGIVIAFGALQAVHLVESRIRTLAEWDVRVFWIYGQLMAHHENIYALEPYQQFYQTLSPSREFIGAVLEVGGTYPPPTMFLFRPLGCCDMRSGFVYWYVFVGLSILAAVELLRRIFFRSDGIWGLALLLFLFIALKGTWDTIRFGQTNFLTLVFLLLYWKDRDRPRAGIWIALGAIVKLYLVVLLLDALFLKRWRVLAWAALTGFVLSAASVILLGPQTFSSYFTLHPMSRVPRWVYMEWVNQSLLATILRSSHSAISRSPAMNPIFIISALILFLLSAWLVHRSDPGSPWSLALWLLLGLLVFPGTLAHYSVMLLPAMLLIWKEREKTRLGSLGGALLLTFIVALVGFHSQAFAGYAVTWIAVAVFVIQTTQAGKSGAPRNVHLRVV
jgi:hypothetical protein